MYPSAGTRYRLQERGFILGGGQGCGWTEGSCVSVSVVSRGWAFDPPVHTLARSAVHTSEAHTQWTHAQGMPHALASALALSTSAA